MRLRSAITLVVMGAAGFVGFPGFVADAGAQYGGNCVLSATGPVVPGGQIQVSGSGFEPNLVTQLIFTDADSSEPLGPITVSGAGTFGPLPFTLPASITGAVTLTAVCDSEGQQGVAGLGAGRDRTPGGDGNRGGGGRLARTGDDSTEPLVAAGAIALVAGTAVVLIARRRAAA